MTSIFGTPFNTAGGGGSITGSGGGGTSPGEIQSVVSTPGTLLESPNIDGEPVAKRMRFTLGTAPAVPAAGELTIYNKAPGELWMITNTTDQRIQTADPSGAISTAELTVDAANATPNSGVGTGGLTVKTATAQTGGSILKVEGHANQNAILVEDGDVHLTTGDVEVPDGEIATNTIVKFDDPTGISVEGVKLNAGLVDGHSITAIADRTAPLLHNPAGAGLLTVTSNFQVGGSLNPTGGTHPFGSNLQRWGDAYVTGIDLNGAPVGTANGLACLDATGKLKAGQIPDLSVVDVFVVATLAARDALSPVQTGDVAKVTSEPDPNDNGTYLYDGAAWIEITADGNITQVNGYTGPSVNLDKTDVGLGNVANAAQLQLTGGTMSGDINMGTSNIIMGAGNTVDGQDVSVMATDIDTLETKTQHISATAGETSFALGTDVRVAGEVLTDSVNSNVSGTINILTALMAPSAHGSLSELICSSVDAGGQLKAPVVETAIVQPEAPNTDVTIPANAHIGTGTITPGPTTTEPTVNPTGPSAPSPYEYTASSFEAGREPWEAFVVPSVDSGVLWCSFRSTTEPHANYYDRFTGEYTPLGQGSQTPVDGANLAGEWLQMKYSLSAIPKQITQYQFRGRGTALDPQRARSWVVAVSDDGTNFTKVHEVIDHVWNPIADPPPEVFIIPNPTLLRFNYVRFIITAAESQPTAGATGVHLSLARVTMADPNIVPPSSLRVNGLNYGSTPQTYGTLRRYSGTAGLNTNAQTVDLAYKTLKITEPNGTTYNAGDVQELLSNVNTAGYHGLVPNYSGVYRIFMDISAYQTGDDTTEFAIFRNSTRIDTTLLHRLNDRSGSAQAAFYLPLSAGDLIHIRFRQEPGNTGNHSIIIKKAVLSIERVRSFG